MRVLDILPAVRGKYRFEVPLAPLVWFRVGGQAEVVFKPEDVDDLQTFLKGYPSDYPLTILGVGSNVLIRDGGIPGVVIKLGRGFNQVNVTGERLCAGGGCLDRTVALTAAEHSRSGLSFLAGIPGTIGGALKMNAGAYGFEIKDVLESCLILTRQGELVKRVPKDLGFSYRKSLIQDGEIVVEATFRTREGCRETALKEISEIMTARENSQPVKGRTGGSTFKNPEGMSAWKLIDAAGCRGMMVGGAQVSEKHANFIMNTGEATACDIETLMERVQCLVLEKENITLDLEIKRLGKKVSQEIEAKNCEGPNG